MDEQDFNLLMILDSTRNITHAAEKLYITQSSVSKRIRQIERELGATLMLRSRQGIHFTPAGEIVLHHVKNVVKELDRLRQDVKQADGDIAGTIRVGVSINYSMYCLASKLAIYNKTYPLVDTNIISGKSQDLYKMLIDGKIDVGILRGNYESWRGERILLRREKICAIIGEKQKDTPLAKLPYIAWHSGIDLEREITQWLQENHVVSSKNRILVDNTSTCLTLVNEGLGWGIVPEICLTNFKGKIRPLYFANGEPLIRSTYMMFSRKVQELSQVRTFIELIHDLSNKQHKTGGIFNV